MNRNLRQALQDLERAGMLKRIRDEVDPYLEMAEIARQAYECGGPAILFEKVKGCRFQAVANLFGTKERMEFLFRDTLESIIYAEHVNLDIRLEINSVRVLLDIVENSPLVTTVSEEAIHHIQGFEAVPIDHPDARMDGCYHYLKGSYRKKSAGEFLRILTENNAFEKAMERF